MTDGPGVQGEPADLAQMVQQVERRNSVLVRLAGGVERLSTEVGSLRRDIADRPTKANVAARRRKSFAALIVYGMLIIWGHDMHVESCSPGSQALDVVEWVAERDGSQELTPGQIARVIDREQPTAICDVTFPLHQHGTHAAVADDVETVLHLGPLDLSGWNLIGLAGYGFLGAMLYLWQRGPRRRDNRD